MGNIMDYIEWRGDLPFTQSEFNDVDNLILACFSYVNLDGIQEAASQNGERTQRRQIFYPLCTVYDA